MVVQSRERSERSEKKETKWQDSMQVVPGAISARKKCIKRSAPDAGRNVKFLLSRPGTGPFIARIAISLKRRASKAK